MTYCCGVLVRDGLVMIADTRTNAGVDNIATYRKLHSFETRGERAIGLATAGNLAVSQSVVSLVTEGCTDPVTDLGLLDIQPTEDANAHIHLDDPEGDEEIGEVEGQRVCSGPCDQRALPVNRDGFESDRTARGAGKVGWGE
jgi:hypothetical protein